MNYGNTENRKYMKRNNPILLILAIALPIRYAAAQTKPLSLDSILSRVAAANPQLQGYEQRSEAMRASASGARAWMAPMAGIGTFMTPYPGQDMSTHTGPEKGSIMVSVEQTIPNRIKQEAGARYLGARANTEAHRRSSQLNLLRAEARSAFHRWVHSAARQRNLVAVERATGLMLEVARVRVSFNQEQASALYKAESRLAEVKNMMEMEQVTMDASRSMLSTLMGLPPDSPLIIDTTLTQPAKMIIPATDTAALAAGRSDIRLLDEEINVMRLNREYMQKQSRPDLRIRFDHMQPIGEGTAQFTAMAMLSIPIAPWSSSMYRSEAAGMQHRIAAMEKERSAMLLESQGMTERMRIQLSGMQRQLERYEQQILPSLERNFSAVKAAWEENREPLSMVLDALEAIGMARHEYLLRKESYHLMITDYEKLVEQ